MNARLEARVVNILLYAALLSFIVFLLVPVASLIAFSFREGRYMVLPFDGWSLHWYTDLFRHPDFVQSAFHSAVVAIVVTVVGAAIGTAAALAWVRFDFRFKKLYQSFVIAPLLMPQIILGLILLLWFSVLGNWLDFSMSLATIIVGHVVYIVPFTLIVVSVQIHALDPAIEDAARDCGADDWTVYREITLPLIAPGILSAAIFAFLLSWGNFYITYSLAGTTRTLPTFIFSGIALGSSPLYAALATVTFLPGLLLVGLAEWLRRRTTGRLAASGRD